jgi:uncharacterized membrane protein
MTHFDSGSQLGAMGLVFVFEAVIVVAVFIFIYKLLGKIF